MKILGMNSEVEFDGTPATVASLTSNGLTLINESGGHEVTISLEQASQQINEKTLKIIKV